MGRNITKRTDDEEMTLGAPVVALPADVTIAEALLNQARDGVADIDDDPSDIVAAMTAAIDAVDACGALQRRARSRVLSEWGLRAGEITRGAERVKMGTVGPRSEVEAAAERYRQTASEAMRTSVAERFADEAAKLGTAAANALREAENAIKKVRVDFAYRSTSRGGKPDLAEVLVRERLSKEIQDRGLAFLTQVYSAARDIGDEDRLVELEDASIAWLRQIITTPAQRLAAKGINARTDSAVEQELSQAIRLLREFDLRAEARLPRAVLIAEDALRNLVFPAWAAIAGWRSWDMSRDAFDRVLRVDGARVPFDRFSFRDDFHRDLISGRPQPPAKSSQHVGVGGAITIPGTRIEVAK